jgi:hypothetical protein
MDATRKPREALSLRHAYRAAFSTDEGRIVLADLCKSACITSSAFTMASDRQTAYDNGARDLVLGILRKIHRNDSDLLDQIEELTKQQYQEET